MLEILFFNCRKLINIDGGNKQKEQKEIIVNN